MHQYGQPGQILSGVQRAHCVGGRTPYSPRVFLYIFFSQPMAEHKLRKPHALLEFPSLDIEHAGDITGWLGKSRLYGTLKDRHPPETPLRSLRSSV